MSEITKKGALFICLGNICRSPIAEAVFLDRIQKDGVENRWNVDSAAIGGWHVGKSADSRALATMKKHALLYDNRCRQITKDDFNRFDYIFGMDNENIADLNERAPKGSKAKILLLGDFDAEGIKIIRDPYYDSGAEGFEQCYVQCVRCVDGFLKSLA